MKPVSDVLRQTVRQGHKRTVRVRLLVGSAPDEYTVVASNFESEVDDMDLLHLTVTDGEVTFDGSSSTGLASARVVIAGRDWAPISADHPLLPFNALMSIEYVFDTDAGQEWVEVGYFSIVDVTTTLPGFRTTVILRDRAYSVDRYLLETPRQWGPSERVIDVIQDLIGEGLGNFTSTLVENDLGTVTIGGDGFFANAGDSRWAVAYALADLQDCDMYLSGDLDVELHVVSRTYVAPTWVEQLTFGESGVVISGVTSVSTLTGYNRVIATVESTEDGQTFRSVRTLDDGPMAYATLGDGAGRMPLVITERVENASQALANSMSNYQFKRQVGAVRTLDLTCVPMPWLEVGDTVLVGSPEGTELAVVERVQVPLTVDAPMVVVTRQRRELATDEFTMPVELPAPEFLGANR